MRRSLVSIATLVLLWSIVSLVNHMLASTHVYLWIGGLFITQAALSLSIRAGMFSSFVGGLLCDASSGVALGMHALLFAAAHAIIFNVRDRVPREETAGRVVIALLANLALFLVFSFLQVSRLPIPGAVWPRIIFDLVCSQIFLALIAPWFFALQIQAQEMASMFIAPDERRLE